MATQLSETRTPPRPPWIVWLGLAVVLAAAAVLSFDALRALAIAVGIPGKLAWLLPIAVDAGAAVSCATWLGGRTTREAATFAGRMTWCLLSVTVIGNAGQLGMHAHGITPPWWVAVLVGAIPPAVVGSTVHLVVLLVRRGGGVAQGVEPQLGSVETPTEPVAANVATPSETRLLDEVDSTPHADTATFSTPPPHQDVEDVEPDVEAGGEDVEVTAIAAVRNGAGRRKLVALGVSEHRAKQLIATHRHDISTPPEEATS